MEYEANAPRLLRAVEVRSRTGLSRSHLYRLMQAGRFPRQRRISHRVAVWLEADIDDWIAGVAAS